MHSDMYSKAFLFWFTYQIQYFSDFDMMVRYPDLGIFFLSNPIFLWNVCIITFLIALYIVPHLLYRCVIMVFFVGYRDRRNS